MTYHSQCIKEEGRYMCAGAANACVINSDQRKRHLPSCRKLVEYILCSSADGELFRAALGGQRYISCESAGRSEKARF